MRRALILFVAMAAACGGGQARQPAQQQGVPLPERLTSRFCETKIPVASPDGSKILCVDSGPEDEELTMTASIIDAESGQKLGVVAPEAGDRTGWRWARWHWHWIPGAIIEDGSVGLVHYDDTTGAKRKTVVRQFPMPPPETKPGMTLIYTWSLRKSGRGGNMRFPVDPHTGVTYRRREAR